MALFWLICLCLAAGTVVILITPFLRGKVSGGIATPAFIALGAPIAAFALYAYVGTPEALTYQANPQAAISSQQRHMAQATEQLAQQLRQEPDNLQGWLMLGRALSSLGKAERAVDAFQQARRLAPENPLVLLQLAMAQGRADDFNLAGEPAVLLARAVQLAPENQQALWYAGIAAYQSGDFDAASSYWERLLPLVEPSSEVARRVQQQLADARRRAGSAATPQVTQADPVAPSQQPGSSNAAVEVVVTLSPELKSQVAPDDTLFIFARAVSGPPMPLAVERHRASELPLTVVLDAGDSMTGARTLASAAQIVVEARVSKSGNAIGSPGDLEGQSSPLRLPVDVPVQVVIDEVRSN